MLIKDHFLAIVTTIRIKHLEDLLKTFSLNQSCFQHFRFNFKQTFSRDNNANGYYDVLLYHILVSQFYYNVCPD